MGLLEEDLQAPQEDHQVSTTWWREPRPGRLFQLLKKGENSWWGESLLKECNDKTAQYSRVVLDILQDHKNLGFYSREPLSS